MVRLLVPHRFWLAFARRLSRSGIERSAAYELARAGRIRLARFESGCSKALAQESGQV
jgi:hypothetical protein